jgi:dihydropteroate synthase
MIYRYNENVRKLSLSSPEIIKKELKVIGVDPRAYPIFIDKAHCLMYKFDGLTSAQANVFKQTALICGADLAIPKHAYSGGRKKSISAILFANRRELMRISQRLKEQPWIEPVTSKLNAILEEKPTPCLVLKNKKIEFERTFIMGAINLTDDSFYEKSRYTNADSAKRIAEQMESEGADFIDIGAESSRPGAEPLTAQQEMSRLKKIFPVLAKHTNVPLSIDTYKADTAAYAIDHGAQIINDISGMTFDKKMAEVVAKTHAAIIIMHIKGTPKNMQLKPRYHDLMGEIHGFLAQRISFALDHGIKKRSLIIDPGLGFGKRLEDNYEIANRLDELSDFGLPILVGHSRKSFIGNPFKLPPEQRLEGTLGFSAILIENKADILRVHDVSAAKRAALLIDKVVR